MVAKQMMDGIAGANSMSKKSYVVGFCASVKRCRSRVRMVPYNLPSIQLLSERNRVLITSSPFV
jgi:hypothetical protein